MQALLQPSKLQFQLFALHSLFFFFLACKRKILTDGYNLSLLPGGSDEMLESCEEKEVVFLKARKGFIRLAIETGAQIVPVYAFGVNDLYSQVGTSTLCCSSVHLPFFACFF
jgi:hypothetical protein